MNQIKLLLILMAASLTLIAPVSGQKQDDFRKMAPEAGPARPVEIGKSHQFTLANGLKVIVVENHKLPQISYQLSIERDPNMEKEKAGLADITGTLLATSTKTKSKSEIDEAVDYIGASLSTNSRGGYASSLTKHTDKILSLFAEVVLEPGFSEVEFEKIKTQTISGLQTNKDDPSAISNNVSNALTYGLDHPYGEITTENTVANITLQDCKDYYNTYFKPGNAYLVIVGDITPEEARKKAEKYFAKWPAGNTPNYTYPFPKSVKNTAVAFVDKPGAVQSMINIEYPVDLKPGSPDDIAANVMNTILGSGFSGRLFKNLREDKGYTYGAYSSISTDKLVGSFSASASVRNEVTDSAVAQFLIELEKLATMPVTQAELNLAKSYMAGSFARSLESPQTVANFARNISRYNLPADYYETYLQRLEAVTVDDITRVAKKYIRPENARIVVVGNQDEVFEKLIPFDKDDGKIELFDIYANPKKVEAAMPSDVSAAQILDGYMKAIGGWANVNAVTSMDLTYSLELMGMAMTSRSVQQDGKYYMNMSAPGMNLMTQIYDGEKGIVEQMGQRIPVEGEDLDGLKEQAILFPERLYANAGYSLEVKGMEDVNGKSAYKMAVTKPSGSKSTEYYDKATFLKIKEIQTTEATGQTQVTTLEYEDYKEVSGIKIPHKVTIIGVLPTPMVMNVSSVKLNDKVDANLFKI